MSHSTAAVAPLTPETATALVARWTTLWNGDYSTPEAFLAPDFRIRFGSNPEDSGTDGIRGPAAIVEMIAGHRTTHPGRRYAVDGTPTVDPLLGRVAACWHVTRPDGTQKSGIDLFEVVDGRIATVWSVTGVRRFAA
ncbi:nuclear transport factor 2 family protein [Streptomyces sp. NPDC057257]|uniref:nuclear transport factor 2 family protein n=1 Tax=Streptomyces sp. NPDC057257 TaxID=3346071 RepID=UPI00362793C3